MGMTSVTCLLSGPLITFMDLELVCLCGLNFPSEKKLRVLFYYCVVIRTNIIQAGLYPLFVFLLISRDHNVPWVPKVIVGSRLSTYFDLWKRWPHPFLRSFREKARPAVGTPHRNT